MSVPADLSRMSVRELQELRARAATDTQASPEVKQRLGEHIRRATANLAART